MSSSNPSRIPSLDDVLSLSSAEAAERLRELGFRNELAALENLRRIAREAVLEPAPRTLLEEIAHSADPDAALNQFDRVAGAAISRPSFYGLLQARPEVCHGLIRLLAASPFLADILVRNPAFFHYLFDTPVLLVRDVAFEDLLGELRGGLAVFRSQDTRFRALRRLLRRELLRLGGSDIAGGVDILTVARGLSDLADAVLQVLIDLLLPPLASRYGVPKHRSDGEVGFAVIALGKLGGQELNFSSDIDLMFVYGSEGETAPQASGQRPISNHEFFNRLAADVVKHATEVTAEGFIYRVDVRLRPEGASSPLARSVSSYERYYEARGEVWERQMLIKARACAGDAATGGEFMEMIGPFVYPAHVDSSPSDEVRRMKEKIEAKLGRRGQRETHLKLRPGGIRDVEFITQALQLLVGGQRPEVRCGRTAEAILALQREGLLSGGEAGELREAYRFYRRLEHRLQMRQNRSAYIIPEDSGDLRPVAISLGYTDASALRRDLDGHLERVRAIYDDVFRPAESTPDLDPAGLCEREPGDPEASAFLRRLGFDRPEDVHRNLIFLAFGHFPKLRGAKAKQHFLDLAPRLIEEARRRSDPDEALSRFERIVASYGAADMLYRILVEIPGLLDLLLGLCAESGFLSELICRNPALLDWLTQPEVLLRDRTEGELSAELSEALAEAQGEETMIASLNAIKNRELLRIGARDVLGLADMRTTLGQLTLLAEAILRKVWDLSGRRLSLKWGPPLNQRGDPARGVVLGLGKLGGEEMDFGSDLDLVFVYSEDGQTAGGSSGRTRDNLRFFIDQAQDTLNLLSSQTSHGLLYHVDARLRPEGGNALLAMSLAGYRRYLRERAATWERLALCRARLVAGDEVFGQDVLDRIDEFVVGDGLSEEEVKDISEVQVSRPDPPEDRTRGDRGRGVHRTDASDRTRPAVRGSPHSQHR